MQCYRFCKDVEVNSRKLFRNFFLDKLSSFEKCWSSLLRMVLWSILLQIDKASLLETFCSLKISGTRQVVCNCWESRCLILAFLDEFISDINNQNLTPQTYHKSTYKGLFLRSFSYKISLIKCLVARSFKICNNWNSFRNDIRKH